MKKLLMYSLDFHGFGHFTRNYKLANYLKKYNDIDIILMTNKIPPMFCNNACFPIIELPNISLQGRPRNYRYLKKLPFELTEISEFIYETIGKMNCTHFYVDLSPTGGYGELREVIPKLKKQNITTVIGLRDILDCETQTKKEWFNQDEQITSANDFDRILVFGHREIFEKLYGHMVDIKKVVFLGYLWLPLEVINNSDKRDIDIFAMFGGGGKAHDQIVKLSSVLDSLKGLKIIFLTGPLINKREFIELKLRYKHLNFMMYCNPVNQFILRSKLTITHGGYNSLMESLSYGHKVLQFPRTGNSKKTRHEQIIRAEYFKSKNICDFIYYSQSKKEINQKILNELNNLIPRNNLGNSGFNSSLFDSIIK